MLKLMRIYQMLILSDGHQKIEMYKRFRGITIIEEMEELQDEMIDRFGNIQRKLIYLFKIAKLRYMHTVRN